MAVNLSGNGKTITVTRPSIESAGAVQLTSFAAVIHQLVVNAGLTLNVKVEVKMLFTVTGEVPFE